jgi:NAD(P)-dependent dehydrogenase (short-subunit alcohol dehydrogenase family)
MSAASPQRSSADANLPSLTGRTIVVTGAARGVGRAIAEACAEAGARLVLADVLEAAGRETAAAIARSGASVRFVTVDLAHPESIARLAADVEAHEGAADGLVNNAAIATGIGGPAFDEIDLDVWDKVMQVNVRGTWLVIRAFAPLLVRSGTGRIVNVASDTALWGAPRLLAYVASKGAVIAMTRSLARELGPRGVGITVVAPGIMRNEATEYVPKQRHELYETGRAVPGAQTPEDIVATILFLLTPGALALTGQTLPVDAGFVFT